MQMSSLRIFTLSLFLSFTLFPSVGRPLWAQQDIATSCEHIAEECPDAVISDIRIIHHDIFDALDPVPSWFPWKTVNRLHINTTEETIRQNLLFKKEERLNVERIRETQRKLNSLGYFRDEALSCKQVEPGRVQVEVYLKENWSLIPILEFQGRGLGQAVTMGFSEQNLLGLGKILSVSYRKGAEEKNTIIEDAWQVSYQDPNILGSRYQLSWTVQGLESGEYLTGTLEKPYFSLETPWSAKIFNTHYKRTSRLYSGGGIAADYERLNNTSGMDLGLALKRGPPVVHRIRAFYRYEQQRISNFRRLSIAADDLSTPPDYTYSYPGVGYRRLGVHYITETQINRFERNEYFNIANDLDGYVAFSAERLGADQDLWIFSLSDKQGYRFRKGHFFMANASANGFLDGDELKNSIFLLTYNHYLQETFLDVGPFQNTFHLEGAFGYGENLDSDKLLGLGYTNGLRGFALNAFTGNKLIRISLEDRIFLKKKVFGLVALGLLLFYDCGYVWETGQEVDLGDLRHDVGFGLRTAVPSASGGNVVQFNWGIPVGSGASPLEDYVFTVTVSSTFD